MLCLPVVNDDATVSWPQLEYGQLHSTSGVQSAGTVLVRARVPLKAESIFPCIGAVRPRTGCCARFTPAALSVSAEWAMDGCPTIDPVQVPLSPSPGGISHSATSVTVGSKGWAFFAYCREPPPSLTLSTAAICGTIDALGLPIAVSTENVPAIILKRDLEPGDELLVAFNQFDAIGRMWTYPTPCPFLRVPSSVPLLRLPSSLNIIRKILADQPTLPITDSYVKLLEDTPGMDARTTERIHVALLNLTKAVQHYIDTDGEVVSLPLVVPVAPVITNTVVAPVIAPPIKRKAAPMAKPAITAPAVPVFAASFRVPQSFQVPKM